MATPFIVYMPVVQKVITVFYRSNIRLMSYFSMFIMFLILVVPFFKAAFSLFNYWMKSSVFTGLICIFSCKLPNALPSTGRGGQMNLPHVHKFMDLNQTDIEYFISLITPSSLCWGFSIKTANQLNI
jgi:hypothetical protein